MNLKEILIQDYIEARFEYRYNFVYDLFCSNKEHDFYYEKARLLREWCLSILERDEFIKLTENEK